MAAVWRIAVIGDWESVMGFQALGLDTFPVTSPEEARDKIRELAKSDYAVIYLTERLAVALPDYDRDRVHASDVKKLFSWYNILLAAGKLEPSEEDEKKEENNNQ